MQEMRRIQAIREWLELNHNRVLGHSEGLYVVCDGLDPSKRKWYHVDEQDHRVYQRNLKFAGDFHDGIAAVEDPSGWFHIYRDGTEVYSGRSRYFSDRKLLVVALEEKAKAEMAAKAALEEEAARAKNNLVEATVQG